MVSSRQTLGPTTLAAPLAILKEKWPAGHALDSPHLYLAGLVAVNKITKVTVLLLTLLTQLAALSWQTVHTQVYIMNE